jgi:ABC-type nickel/cobalt efflux system permease component RcnA
VLLGILSYFLARQGARTAAQNLRETLEVLSPLLLSCFGILYGVYSWRRENRHHPAAGSSREGAGPDDSHHHHGHLLERWFGGGSGWSLVVVIGVSPCALALPVLLAGAAKLGLTGVVLVAGGFGVVTMITTLGVTLLGSISARKVDFPFLTRYGDLITGILIGATGAFLFLWELIR